MSDLTDHYGSPYLNADNTVLVRNVKIGTYTPKTILVHEDDVPLEEGTHFRYVEEKEIHDGHPGFEPDYGVVEETRGEHVEVLFVSLDGMPWKVEELDVSE